MKRKKVKIRPRTKEPEARREELMNAAQRLFLKRGVAETTIEQITSGADVAKGTFYLYFTSKEDVLAALEERFAEELLGRIKAAVTKKKPRDWRGKLETWSTACATGYLDAIRIHDIVFYGSRPATREGLVDNIIIDDLCELLKSGMKAKVWSLDDARFSAVFLFSGLHAAVDEAYSKEKRINRKRLARRVKRICFRAAGVHGR